MKEQTKKVAAWINEMIEKHGNNLSIDTYTVDSYSYEKSGEESYTFGKTKKAVTSTHISVEREEEEFDDPEIKGVYNWNNYRKSEIVSLVPENEKESIHGIIYLSDKTDEVVVEERGNTLIIREILHVGYNVYYTEIHFSA